MKPTVTDDIDRLQARIAELEQHAEYDRKTIENARWAKNFNLESFQHARKRIIELEQQLKQANDEVKMRRRDNVTHQWQESCVEWGKRIAELEEQLKQANERADRNYEGCREERRKLKQANERVQSIVNELNKAIPLIRMWTSINSSMGPDLQTAGNILSGILAALPNEQNAYLAATAPAKEES